MAVKVALDTNAYVAFARGDEELTAILEGAEAVAVPFSVVGELRAGFVVGSRGAANDAVLREFLGRPGVGVLWARDATTRIYASLFAYLRERGTPIPSNDLWIAALCLENGFALRTDDRHFDALPQVPRA